MFIKRSEIIRGAFNIAISNFIENLQELGMAGYQESGLGSSSQPILGTPIHIG